MFILFLLILLVTIITGLIYHTIITQCNINHSWIDMVVVRKRLNNESER